MPNRILRAGILSSDRVDALSPEAEVFYRRLMSMADDYGRADGDWRVLRSSLYPKKTDHITEEQIESWLSECSRLLEGEREALVAVYVVDRKRYLEISNFGQRTRTPSRFPAGPPSQGVEARPLSYAANGEQMSAHARATNSHPHPPSLTIPTPTIDGGHTGGNRETEPESDQREIGFNHRAYFDELTRMYPLAGRVRLEAAFEAFVGELEQECKLSGQSHQRVLEEIRAGLERWNASDQWQRGKVHLLRNFLSERLWREEPLSATDAEESARSPAKRASLARLELLKRVTLEPKKGGTDAGE